MSVEKTPTRRYELRKRADAMEATRRRITEAAVELHGSVGPARTTITAIAERAGVQRQTVYRHFPSEDDLFAACTQHFYEGDRWPDPVRWRAIGDPAERLAFALDELYAYYERTESMWTNVLRDETLVPSVAAAITGFWAYLDAAADALAAGWSARGGRRRVLHAATRHAVDFRTWRSLARDGGISRAAVVELASAMVSRASGRYPSRLITRPFPLVGVGVCAAPRDGALALGARQTSSCRGRRARRTRRRLGAHARCRRSSPARGPVRPGVAPHGRASRALLLSWRPGKCSLSSTQWALPHARADVDERRAAASRRPAFRSGQSRSMAVVTRRARRTS